MPIDLKVQIDGVEQVTSGLKKIETEMEKMKSTVTRSTSTASADIKSAGSGIGSIVSKIAPIAAGVGGAVFAIKELGGQVIDVIQDYTTAYYEADKVAKLWDVSFRNNAGAVGMTSDALDELSKKIQANSVYDDDLIKESQAMLLNFKELGANVFPAAQQAAADMSARLGIDMVDAAKKIGIALADPISGLAKLRREGIVLSDQQEKQIKSLVASGKAYEAQGVILAELSSRYAGAAKAVADTPLGQLQIFKNMIGDIKESIGGLIIDGLTPILDVLSEITEGIGISGESMDLLRRSMRSLGLIVGAVIRSIIGNIKIAVGVWQTAVDFVIFSVGLVIRSFQTVKSIVTDVVSYISSAIKMVMTGDIQGIIDYVSTELPALTKKITKTLNDNALENKKELQDVGKTFGKAIDAGVAEGMKAQTLMVEALKFNLKDEKKVQPILHQAQTLGEDIATSTVTGIQLKLNELQPKMMSFADKIKSEMGENFETDDEKIAQDQATLDSMYARMMESTILVGSIHDAYVAASDGIAESFGSSFSQVITGTGDMRDAVTSVLDTIGSAAQDVVAEGVSATISGLLKKAGAKIVSAVANIYEWFSTLPPPVGIPLAIAAGGALVGGFFAARKKLGYAEGGVWSGGPAMIIPISGRGPVATISEDGRPEQITPATGGTPSTTIVINSEVIDSQGLITLTDKISLENKKQSRYMRGGS